MFQAVQTKLLYFFLCKFAADFWFDVFGKGELLFMLPAFYFDGERYFKVVQEKNVLSVYQDGWVCNYVADGEVFDLERRGANRNGLYKAFAVKGKDKITIKVQIVKE